MYSLSFSDTPSEELNAIFSRQLKGEALSKDEIDKYKTELMLFLAGEYNRLGWGMEIHIGAMRNNNGVMFKKLGPDTGYDSVADFEIAVSLSRLLDAMLCGAGLPKTVLFTLNPKDNYVLGTMLGNFQSDEAESKIQFGSAWWFNDNYDGMRTQMQTLMNLGVISKFVGMITDSRSFLSYPRHEYFRRILCNLIGEDIQNGKLPKSEMEFIHQMVKDISYNNADRYFNF